MTETVTNQQEAAAAEKPAMRWYTLHVYSSMEKSVQKAIIDRIADGSIDASIELVVSSRASAYGLVRAQAAGIQTLTMDKSFYEEAGDYDKHNGTTERFVYNAFINSAAEPVETPRPSRSRSSASWPPARRWRISTPWWKWRPIFPRDKGSRKPRRRGR